MGKAPGTDPEVVPAFCRAPTITQVLAQAADKTQPATAELSKAQCRKPLLKKQAQNPLAEVSKFQKAPAIIKTATQDALAVDPSFKKAPERKVPIIFPPGERKPPAAVAPETQSLRLKFSPLSSDSSSDESLIHEKPRKASPVKIKQGPTVSDKGGVDMKSENRVINDKNKGAGAARTAKQTDIRGDNNSKDESHSPLLLPTLLSTSLIRFPRYLSSSTSLSLFPTSSDDEKSIRDEIRRHDRKRHHLDDSKGEDFSARKKKKNKKKKKIKEHPEWPPVKVKQEPVW